MKEFFLIPNLKILIKFVKNIISLMKLYWLFSVDFWCQASTSHGLFWFTFHGDPDKTQGKGEWQWCELGSHGGALWSSVPQCPPCFYWWTFLSSARDNKIIEVICFILCVRIFCKRNAIPCFNKVMLLIKPSWKYSSLLQPQLCNRFIFVNQVLTAIEH